MLIRLWVDGSQDKVSIIKRTVDFGTKVQSKMFRCQLMGNSNQTQKISCYYP